MLATWVKTSYKRRLPSMPTRQILNFHWWQLRRGSRINTDRFPKRAPRAQASRGIRGILPRGNVVDFNSLKSPFLGFWVIQTGYWSVPISSDEAWPIGGLFHQGQFPCCSGYGVIFQLGKFFFLIKNIFIMKNLTDFLEKIETDLDQPLWLTVGSVRYFER